MLVKHESSLRTGIKIIQDRSFGGYAYCSMLTEVHIFQFCGLGTQKIHLNITIVLTLTQGRDVKLGLGAGLFGSQQWNTLISGERSSGTNPKLYM